MAKIKLNYFLNLLFAIVLLLLAKSSRAQVTLLNTIEHIQYRIVAVNDFGEFYALKNKTNLIKLSANGDSMNLFKGFYSGEITNVDATNPLNVLVEYGFVNKAIVMDRLLIPKWEIDFQKLD